MAIGFSRTKRPQYHLGTKILLDDAIYNDGPPAIVKGHLFVYEVTAIHDDGKNVTLTYRNQVIKDGGDEFTVYEETTETQVSKCNRLLQLFSFCF